MSNFEIDPIAASTIQFGTVFDDLLERRTLMLAGDVEEETIAEIIAALLELSQRDPKSPIHLFVASWGGSLADALALYDVMKSLACPVNTYALGKACSAGALILAAGTGRRYAYPSTRVMIHQPSGGISYGTITDNKINAANDDAWKKTFLEALAESSGQTYEKVEADCERDKWFDAKAAMEYGLVDELVILHRRKTAS